MKKIVQFVKRDYIYLQVTPIIGLRNYNNKDLAANINRSILSLSKLEKVYNDETDKFDHLKINGFANISYILRLSKKDTRFIFKVPEEISKQFTSKLQETFKDSLITEVEFKEKDLKFKKYLAYKNEDPLSLHVDSRQQELINNLIENIEMLDESDFIEVKLDFFKIGRVGKIQFQDYIKCTEKKIKNRESVRMSDGIVAGISGALLNTGKEMVNALLMTKKDSVNKFTEIAYALTNQEEFKLTKATLDKKKSDIVRVAIQVSSSNKKALESTLSSFTLLDEDNALVPKKNFRDNIMSVQEAGQLIQLCGNSELMDKYNIDYLKHKEIKVPAEILKGSIPIGTCSYRNSKQNIYLSDDGSNKFLPTVYTGPTRSGKTTLIQNTIYNAIKNGDSVIFFDFIETCRASNEILEVIPKEKVTIINLAKKVEGLDFNEIKMSENLEPKQKYKMLKLKANGILALVDSCNLTNDEELKSQMRKILMSITLIAMSQDKTFKVAIDALQDHILRKKLINDIPEDLKPYLNDSVYNIKALDEKSKSNGAITGTKTHLVNSILNRLYSLQMNESLEEMLNTDSKNNVNLIDEMQKGKFIVIQIPDSIASTNPEKDIICSYYFNKVWFALQQRAEIMDDSKKKRLLLIVDEIYQLENTEILFKQRINQIAKYYCKFIVSCHGISQISNLKKELLTADASYVLISGTDESCLKDLGTRFKDYTAQDLDNLKQYHALCSIKTRSNGYVQCITKLPPSLKK